MCLIQPLKFRTLKMGCFKMPHLQMALFQMVATVASEPGKSVLEKVVFLFALEFFFYFEIEKHRQLVLFTLFRTRKKFLLK